ncbi:MAG: RNA polymerase sigma-54 factor [Bacteroidetes bacterium 4572_112]|nr:MAG: RNA polymerase sigma-54 factor [Bacteroidetes bacterium 4572_112]
MLRQRLQQKLQQKLSPQQIQLMKLLQVPTIALEQRIKQEVEENVALEEGEEEVDMEDNNDDLDSDIDAPDEKEDTSDDEFDLSDYIDPDDAPDYKYESNNNSKDDEEYEIPFVSGSTFHDLLRNQLAMRSLSEEDIKIAEFIIGNLDDSGYLRRETLAMVDDLAFAHGIETSEERIEGLITMIQNFEPAGVCARNLQECLQLQLIKKEETESIILAKKILDRFFDAFTKKHYSNIIKRLNITEEDLKEAIEEIIKLNPKPGNSLSESMAIKEHIVPDFLLTNENGKLVLNLNGRNAPELRISRTYRNMLEAYSEQKGKNTKQMKEAMTYVRQKIDSAKWFIDAIKQRQNTLQGTMQAILEYQYEYFQSGDETKLRPMILKDIAEIVSLDISTISRVVNSKYIQTPFGTFKLKTFFSEGMQTQSGEEVSTREIKKILQNSVASENKHKPLTDEKLAALLKEKGYNIARRTIAKYREQLDIPVARLRKEL